MAKVREIQWEREGKCIRCTSHKISAGNGYVRIYRNRSYDTVARMLLTRRHGGMFGLLARHTCDNRWCINPEHILIGTYKDNVNDMISRGRAARSVFVPGEKHHNARLSDFEVKEIKSSAEPNRSLAEKYGVGVATIADIRKKRTWNPNP